MKKTIHTSKAPAAIGPYSQAIQSGNTIYFSGQIPIDPTTQQLISGDIAQQTIQVFENLKTIAEASGGNLNAIVRVCIYLTDLANFTIVNETMMKYFDAPYPARTTIGVAALPKNALIEIDAIMITSV